MSYKVNETILEKWENEKFYKKDIRLVMKEIMKYFGLERLRGMKEIELIGKKIDGGFLICEISYFKNDYRKNRDYGYDINLFDDDGNLVYDESDGEIVSKDKIKTYVNNFDYVFSYDDENKKLTENLRKKLFYPYI